MTKMEMFNLCVQGAVGYIVIKLIWELLTDKPQTGYEVDPPRKHRD